MNTSDDKLTNQYKSLQNMVNQSTNDTNKQLGLINANSYIGGFILMAFTLGILYFLNIFEYWIPTGFILFYFLLFTALRSIRKSFIGKDDKDALSYYREKHREINERIACCMQKNLAIIMQSLVIIYIISFFILLSIQYQWIEIAGTIDLIFPAFTILIFLPVPFFIEAFTQLFKPAEIKATLQDIIKNNQQSMWKVPFTWDFMKPFIFASYFALLLSMPMLSIWSMRSIIIQWPYMLLIFIMQASMIVLFVNSFSASTVRKELATTMTTYADINFLINMATLNDHYTPAEYQHLSTLYQAAKPYDFQINDTFKFINYYQLQPNRFYLKDILKQTVKTAAKESQPEPKEEKQTPIKPIQTPAEQPSPKPNFIKPQISRSMPQNMISKSETTPPSSDDLAKIMDKKIEDIKLGKVGILLYGPLLDDISKEIKTSLKNHISRIRTPFKVELARKNDDLGGAPELVPVGSGGTHVNGDLLILKDNITETQARDMLARMEDEFEIRSIENFYGVDKVYYPAVKRNINQITPEKLAKLTIDSVINTDTKDPDGFTYLMNLRKYNIKTPMSEAIEEEILNQTASNSLLESRRKLEQVKKIKSSIE